MPLFDRKYSFLKFANILANILTHNYHLIYSRPLYDVFKAYCTKKRLLLIVILILGMISHISLTSFELDFNIPMSLKKFGDICSSNILIMLLLYVM